MSASSDSETPLTDAQLSVEHWNTYNHNEMYGGSWIPADFARSLEKRVRDLEAKIHEYAKDLIAEREKMLADVLTAKAERDAFRADAVELAKHLEAYHSFIPSLGAQQAFTNHANLLKQYPV
jgi:hypothetical protein